MSALAPLEFANQILDIAIVAVPAIFGLGALASFAYGVVSTGNALVKEGMSVLKFGASVIGGAALGAWAGLNAGLGAIQTSRGVVGIGKALSTAGKEAFKGAIEGASGSRGLHHLFHRTMNYQEIERKLLEEAGGTVSATHRIEKDGVIQEVSITRPKFDTVGKFSKRYEKWTTIDVDKPTVDIPSSSSEDKKAKNESSWEEEAKPKHEKSIVVNPYDHPEEFRNAIILINRSKDISDSKKIMNARKRFTLS